MKHFEDWKAEIEQHSENFKGDPAMLGHLMGAAAAVEGIRALLLDFFEKEAEDAD